MERPDIAFYFDPVCPFAWITSTWVRQVAALRSYAVDWRFISLRMVNVDVDYDTHFPPGYEVQHTAGLRLLRVAARTSAEHGRRAVGSYYAEVGTRIFDSEPVERPDDPGGGWRGRREFVEPILAAAGLPTGLASALDDESLDPGIRAETDEALGLTGKDVGTPIVQVEPPDGAAFFGPVISRLPDENESLALWDHVVALAGFPGFAELKRSLRERPRLRALGSLA